MDAALDLVWSQSYGAITIDDICKKAEVKKPTLESQIASLSNKFKVRP